MNFVKKYIDKIKSGEILVSKKVRKFYLNIIEPIINDEHDKYYFDEKPGLLFINFAEGFCRQSKSKWHGKLIQLMLWQKAFYQAFFGILHRETGERRFTETFLVVGRKNGKSMLESIFGLFMVLINKGAETYVAATNFKQASRIWDEARQMIESNKYLSKRFKSRVFPEKTIENLKNDSTFKVLSKNFKSQDGLNIKVAIIDEVHELKREVYDILKQGMSAQDEPIMAMITTAGFVREGLFDDTYSYSTQVLDGIIEDDTLMPVIYELDSVDEIKDEANWIKANPGIDVIKNRDFLRNLVERMKTDMNLANTVKVKDFNIIGVENKTWLSYEDFNNTEVYSDEELKRFNNTIVVGGFDLSRTGDLTAFTTLLFDKEKQKIIAITQYWITSKFFDDQRQVDSKVPWGAWIDRGLIRISGVDLIDYHDIANYALHNTKKYGWIYDKIYYDSYSAQYLVKELASFGFSETYTLIPARQGYITLSSPMQLLAAHLRNKTLVYQNNPVTKWCISNVELEEDRNGNMMPSKRSNKRSAKIDGFSTILNCYVGVEKNMNNYL